MDLGHASRLAADYALGSVRSVEQAAEGILNHNYILRTERGDFFVKSVREKRKADLPYIAAVEAFMRGRAIPAICMLEDARGEKWREYDGSVYAVYPFIESDRSHAYAHEDYQRIGAMLGRIHQAGSRDIPRDFTARQYREKDAEVVREKLERFRSLIAGKPARSGTDEAFLAHVERKLRLIPGLASVAELPNTTLVHGDYHAGNLLIDAASRVISGVCDWEKAEMAPRAYELARSVLYVSFHEGYVADESITTARHFLAGYGEAYPIDRSEIEQGFAMRLYHAVASTWLEEHYYDQGDDRGNKFIENEDSHLRDFVEGDMLERVLD